MGRVRVGADLGMGGVGYTKGFSWLKALRDVEKSLLVIIVVSSFRAPDSRMVDDCSCGSCHQDAKQIL